MAHALPAQRDIQAVGRVITKSLTIRESGMHHDILFSQGSMEGMYINYSRRVNLNVTE